MSKLSYNMRIFPRMASALFMILVFTSCQKGEPVTDRSIENKKDPIEKKEEGTFSVSKQQLLKLQMKSGPQSIKTVDCSRLDKDGEQYCTSEKTKLEKLESEIGWADIYKKGDDYIKNYDCSMIKQDVGKSYCNDYKKNIGKNNEQAIQGMNIPLVLNKVDDCNMILNRREKSLCIKSKNVSEVTAKLAKISLKERKNYECKDFEKPELVEACKNYLTSLK